MSNVTILRRLGKQNVTLQHDGSLLLPGSVNAPPLSVAAETVDTLLSEDLIAVDRGAVRRSRAGEMYLRRALAAVPEDQFTAQHREMVVETRTRDAITVTANAAESPLGWLATRRDRNGAPMISRMQLEAGRRLAMDHERALRRERVTQSWDLSGVHGDGPRDRLTVSEAAHDAQRRVREALDAVGPEMSSVLYEVCCEERGLEMVEKQHGWPARCGKVILRLALDRLAQHYGMAPSVSGAARAGLVHWGADGYRPSA
ncbi:DUF6456 domain-containing protein [Acuticoccus sp. I52.16.1]|uniref:DUF6456 domain-containing protein n=1 Tax=Acuticoccus sp. I52.16.1 TaxID=2928472 RepID=UPI001FD00F74|nr:DUF6456 domain-containing protein [Acuticoccus sp. I52.16.1]UOM34349.1 DUF6456 domain-containing protein [Acuticoccus sp. I52.16.1]